MNSYLTNKLLILSIALVTQVTSAIPPISVDKEDRTFVDASKIDFQGYDPFIIYKKYDTLLLPKYMVDLHAKEYYKFLKISEVQINILLNPCQTIPSSECYIGSPSIQDNPMIRGGPDLQLTIFNSNYFVQCDRKWAFNGICGTYLEIHRPLQEEILFEKIITIQRSITPFFEYIQTKALCAGKYEIWFVVRGRVGSIIQYIKPFFIEYPSCI